MKRIWGWVETGLAMVGGLFVFYSCVALVQDRIESRKQLAATEAQLLEFMQQADACRDEQLLQEGLVEKSPIRL